MFNKLSKIDWSKKRLAQGAASEVPDRVRALASTDPLTRREAHDWLRTQLILDGRYLPINGDLTEVILDGLDQDPLPEPRLIIMLAVDLAVDDHLSYLAERFAPRIATLKGAQKKAFESLTKRTNTFHQLLTARDQETAVSAALALGFLGNQSGVIDTLTEALKQSKNDALLASLLIALGMASDHRPAQLEAFLSEGHSLSVRCAVAVGLSLHDETPSRQVAELLVATYQEEFPGVPWANGRLRAYPTSQLWNRGPSYAQALGPDLSDLYQRFTPDNERDRFTLTDATLLAAFPGGKARAQAQLTREEITDPQKQVLTKVRELKINTAMLKELGLPLLDQLGLVLDPPTILDRILTLPLNGQTAAMPFWKALEQEDQIPSVTLKDALITQIPKTEVFDTLVAACAAVPKIPAIESSVLIECLEFLGESCLEAAHGLRKQLLASREQVSPQSALLALWPATFVKETLGKELAPLLLKLTYIYDADSFMTKMVAVASGDALLQAEIDPSDFA